MTRFSVLGRALEAVGTSPRLGAWLSDAWRFDEYEVQDARFTISLEPASPPSGARGRIAPPVRAPGIELPCLVLEENLWEIGGPRAGVRLGLGPRGSHIAFWGADDPGHDAILYPALFTALYESLRASGLVPLHASVIEREGEATALVARSGTGKSSTLVQAIRAGWRPIAEDFAWLEPGSHRLFGWDRGVHLWPEARQRFAADRSGWSQGSDGKLFLPWDALGESRPRTARLRTFALLVRDAARTSAWEPLPARDAVRALWEAIGVPLSDTSRHAVAALLPDLLSRLRARRLILGNTPLPL